MNWKWILFIFKKSDSKKGIFRMDAYEYGEMIKSLTKKIDNIKNIVKPDILEKRLSEIDEMQQDPSFWSDVV